MENTFQQIFKREYNRISFTDNVLLPIFQNSIKEIKIFEEQALQEVELTETDLKSAKKIFKYGELVTNDNKRIDLYEVTLQDTKQVKLARVGIGALVKKLIIGNNAAFVNFKYKEIENRHWRFSFIAYDSFFEDGQVISKETNPKRYTYVFGDKDETYRTAIDRFSELFNATDIKVKDIQNAFAVEAMSDEFFKEYREVHYQNFIRFLTGEEIQKKGSKYQLVEVQKPSNFLISVFNGDKKEARNFCKKLLGQIVFLYFLQKKGWLGASNLEYQDGDKNFIQNFYKQAGENDTFYPVWLSKLFYDTLNEKRTTDNFEMPNGDKVKIPYLNGGLFEKENTKYDFLVFPSDLFSSLFEFFNRFNFTIYENSPEEHTIAVDPEMLGHIFENLLEDNKDKGAFYTPKEIVQYMTQESLIEYLATHIGKNEKEGISTFVKQKNKEFLSDKVLKQIDRLLDEVKVCDPAIGSGAFPMGLLQEIFMLKERIAFDLGFSIWSPATVKESIIQNSIYGVDIEKGAVDIAQLRFWLSLVVDEDKPKPLPNLAYKIVVGNSLVSKFGNEIIEIDWEVESNTQFDMFGSELENQKAWLLNEISKKQKQFFSASNKDKKKINKAIRKLKLEILSTQLKLMIETRGVLLDNSKKKTKKQTEAWLETEGWKRAIKEINTLKKNDKPFEHFDWKLDFPEILNPLVNENAGFDIVIGNPPYIKEYTNKSVFDGFRNSKYYQGKMDLWYGFACVSIDLLKEKGVECFIAQNNWITSAGASTFRDNVLTRTEIKLFTDFWNYKVFKSAGIQTMVYLLQKTTPKETYPLKYSVLNDDSIKESQLTDFLRFDLEQKYASKHTLEFKPKTFINKLITFNNPKINQVLKQILNNDIDYLKDEDIAQGIVFPQDRLNKKNKAKLGSNFQVNQGIFLFNKKELETLDIEYELLKPFYTTSELGKYYGDKDCKEWMIYAKTQIKNEINSYPKFKKHIEQFSGILTSDNKPYGLHRARNENFFVGEKIISIRKNNEPYFTYTDFDCYVSQTFYSIKSSRFNLKYLTALLNSSLIKFWLRYKGKMQGDNFQVDKEPLLYIPIKEPKNVEPFVNLVDYILYLKSNKDILTHTDNESISSHLENIIDMMVYELYFETHMKEEGLNVLEFIEPKPFNEQTSSQQKSEIIKEFYEWYQEPENVVRQRMLLIETRSPNILALINSSTI
ncbi:N-6 DNA methylase [Tenacibaculum dicentrarchi]|nr:N-6 DNA methylase [Tenacibaculum dicentrarchi]